MDVPGREKEEKSGELWRRQCARHLMDCYGLGMQALAEDPGADPLENLVRLIVDGMTAVRGREDERSFYRTAAGLCRTCAAGGIKAAGFRIYAAIFEDMAESAGKEEVHGTDQR